MAGLVIVTHPARAVLLTAFAGLILVVVQLPRLEERVFGPTARPAVPVRPEVITTTARPPSTNGGLGAEGHRAYARALHAVTGAYLAECERESQR